ncbi:conserved hypothetical protein [Thermobifida fusca YX]|nr:conserved hypothetical protein [Thermobifida fusca YX]
MARVTEAVHPHVRGAHSALLLLLVLLLGPSPRAWGSRSMHFRHRQGRRSIPTCVGLTARLASAQCHRTVHPHVRGAHQPSSAPPPTRGGPSPRAWGSLSARYRDIANERSIPTCVGLTGSAGEEAARSAVHPHVRGAHGTGRTSPPEALRSIPTCVGLTPCPLCWGQLPLVHPHVRGAHDPITRAAFGQAGPSPRAWGSQKLTCNFARRYLLVTKGVDNFLGISAILKAIGPSPRAWGSSGTSSISV